MSKNRNRAKLSKAKNNKEYKSKLMFMDSNTLCIICIRRTGYKYGGCNSYFFKKNIQRNWKKFRKKQ